MTVTLLERRSGQCAFPVAGEGLALLYCGAPASPHGYCAEHLAAVYRPSRPAREGHSIQPYPRPVAEPAEPVALDELLAGGVLS